jgi:N-acetyl-anhydromuramyl-L-alanine amidase AmpD
MIVASDPFKSAPRISRQRFRQLLAQMAAAPVTAERDSGEYWDVIAGYGVDPCFIAAMFHHESQMGKAGVAQQTHSWGNTREPNFGATPVGTVAGRSGTFPQWANWLDGCKSTAARLVEPSWVYANRTSIRDIFDWPPDQTLVWAPAGDLNNPDDYLRSVLDFMNQYADQQGAPPVAGDDSRFEWTPDESEFGYPQGTHGRGGQQVDLIVLHITAGTDSQDWLLGGNGSSTHYLTDRAGRPRSQMVREADAAWTAGNRLYNQRGINVEVEMRRVTDWTDAIMQETARTIAPIMAHNNIPAVYLGRANGPGKRGMIGHRDVPNPLPSSTPNYCGPWGGSACHSDPGAGFDWTTFTGYVAAALASATPPQPNPGPSADTRIINGYTVQFGFKALYEALERAGLHTQCLGLPLGNEIPAPFAGVDSMQVWERGYLVFQKAENPDVTVATRELWPQLEEAKP